MNADPDNDIDRLYVAPRDQFVHERNALARQLRTSGDRAAAAEVAALRKPTLVAWVVNQLAHTQRRDVDLLLDAGKRIIDAQQASITSGGRAELDTARNSLREAVNTFTGSAATILGTNPPQTTLTRVAVTLRSAATDPRGRELLARGQLTEELNETGWEIVAGFSPAPRPRTGPGGSDAPSPGHAREIRTQDKRIQDLGRSRAAAEKRQRKAHDQEQSAAKHLQLVQQARATADAELEAINDEIRTAEQRIAELRMRDNLDNAGT